MHTRCDPCSSQTTSSKAVYRPTLDARAPIQRRRLLPYWACTGGCWLTMVSAGVARSSGYSSCWGSKRESEIPRRRKKALIAREYGPSTRN